MSSREIPEQETILNRAAVRWHSDDPIVCLQRALVEVEQLEIAARELVPDPRPPMERVIEGLANLSRIADTLEVIAARIAPPPCKHRFSTYDDGGSEWCDNCGALQLEHADAPMLPAVYPTIFPVPS